MNNTSPGYEERKAQNAIVEIYRDYANSTVSVPGLTAAFKKYEAIRVTQEVIRERHQKKSVGEALSVQRTLEDRWERAVLLTRRTHVFVSSAGSRDCCKKVLNLERFRTEPAGQRAVPGDRPSDRAVFATSERDRGADNARGNAT